MASFRQEETLHTRLIASLCDQELPDVVLQLRAGQVSLLAEALLTHQPEREDLEDHEELMIGFCSLRRMLDAAEASNR